MIGICTASAIYRALLTISLMVNSPTSGKPRSAAVPAPVIYTAGKPTASAILACMAFRIKGATTIGPVCKSWRSLAVVFIDMCLLHPGESHVPAAYPDGACRATDGSLRPSPAAAAQYPLAQ